MAVIAPLIIFILISCACSQEWDWEVLGTHEYTVQTGYPRAWAAANRMCMDNGGYLISINSQQETDWLLEKFDELFHSGNTWIGLNRVLKEDWEWSDRSSGDKVDWDTTYPRSDLYGLLCTYVSLDSAGLWRNEHCDAVAAFACERQKGSSSTIPDEQQPLVDGGCPKGYFGLTNKCYKVVPGTASAAKDFDSAMADCRAGPGKYPDLASFQNAEETAAVLVSAPDWKEDTAYWIGMHHPSIRHTWRWTDNSPVAYTYWAPSLWQAKCAYMQTLSGRVGSWDDDTCNKLKGYVCHTYKDNKDTQPQWTPSRGSCDVGWFEFDGNCFEQFVQGARQPATWDDARDDCRRQGADLASIHSDKENAGYLLMMTPSGEKGNVWIGMKKDKDTRAFKWSNNAEVTYTIFGREEDHPDSEPCVSQGRNSYWYEESCNVKRPYICTKRKILVVLPTVAPEKTECPVTEEGTWTLYKGHCYLLIKTSGKSWIYALGECAKKHMQSSLISIHNEDEAEFVLAEWQKKLGSSTYNLWMGLHRSKKDGSFQWTDLQPLQYEPWAPDNPTEKEGEDCVRMHMSGSNKGKWTNTKCSSYNYFMCKVEADNPTVTPADHDGNCPTDNWQGRYGWFCYLFKPDHFVQFDNGQNYCSDQGLSTYSTISRAGDVAENRYIAEGMHEHNIIPGKRRYWIALRRADKDSPYMWQDTVLEEPKQTFWARNPPNPATTFHCVTADTETGLWWPTSCTTFHGVVCKIHKDSTTPPHQQRQSGVSGGTVVGIVIGILLLFAVLASLIVGLLFYRQQMWDTIAKYVPTSFHNPNYENQKNETDTANVI